MSIKNITKQLIIRNTQHLNIVLMESIPDFSDNSIAIYNKMQELGYQKKYKIIWCVHDKKNLKNKNYKTILFDKKSKKFKILNLIATHTFYTHKKMGNKSNPQQVRVFLTHGFSFKKTTGKFWNPDFNTFSLCLSELHKNLRTITMPGGEKTSFISGFPRNDALFSPNSTNKDFLNIPSNKKLILWLPTFRHLHDSGTGSKRNDYGDSSKSEFNLLTPETLKKLDKFLEEENCFLVVKYHPNQDEDYISTTDCYQNIKTFTSKQFVQYGVDLYSLLACTDGLIADFSSVYIDFLLVNRPIAFDISDMNSYSSGLGFSVENPLEYMPGPIINNENDLYDFIKNLSTGIDDYKDERKKVIDILHANQDNNATIRVIEKSFKE